MKGIAIERWSSKRDMEVNNWLRECAGNPTKDTWFIDYDYDLITLILSDELYVMYKLKYETV